MGPWLTPWLPFKGEQSQASLCSLKGGQPVLLWPLQLDGCGFLELLLQLTTWIAPHAPTL